MALTAAHAAPAAAGADATAVPATQALAPVAPSGRRAELERAADPQRAQLERLAEDDIKRLYLACSEAAVGRRLGRGGVAHCSVVYDVLLKRHFGGDFHALLAWSREQ